MGSALSALNTGAISWRVMSPGRSDSSWPAWGDQGGLLLGRRSYWLGMSRCCTAQQRCVDSPWCDARSIICDIQMIYAIHKACMSHIVGRFALSSS
jgi:hypothetical protein